jgi:hypothetical protein
MSHESSSVPMSSTISGEIPSVLDMWDSGQESPNTFAFAQQTGPLHQFPSQQESDVRPLPEIDFEDVGDFLSRTKGLYLPFTTSPYITVTNFPPEDGRDPSSSSSLLSDPFGVQTPLTPQSDSLTTATTITTSDMSRQGSLLGPFEMLNVHSNVSIASDGQDMQYYQSTQASQAQPSLNEERAKLLVGAGGVSHDPNMSNVFAEGNFGDLSNVHDFLDRMQRSSSNESNASNGSTASRSKQQLQRQIQYGARPIKPKHEDEFDMSRQASSSSMIRIESKDGAPARMVAPISKAPYQRPKHDRVYCHMCDEKPDGFRGEHELRRHQDREHKLIVKKYICVEPSDWQKGQLKPDVPLSKCKTCHTQKKKYGVYYNAAAHLRRTHFNPKPRGRGKGAKADDKSEKRGGKGGGNWPPMSELKRWMREVDELVVDNQQLPIDDESDESDDETSILDANSMSFPDTSGLDLETKLLTNAQMMDKFTTSLTHDFNSTTKAQFTLTQAPSIQFDPSFSFSSTSMNATPPIDSLFSQNFDNTDLSLDFDLPL